MSPLIELHTQRLLLRQWKESDLAPFAQMNACEKVMKYFPQELSTNESNNLAKSLAEFIMTNHWGFWAIEEKETQNFIGFTGIKPIPDYLSSSPAVEIGWRLNSKFWHKGYASEAAHKSLEFAFDTLNIEQVFSYTAKINKPSEKVMQRIGMFNTGANFNHPKVDKSSPLREHVLYRVNV